MIEILSKDDSYNFKFIFQEDWRKSDFARPNSSKAVVLKTSQKWKYLIIILRDISAVTITQCQRRIQKPFHI